MLIVADAVACQLLCRALVTVYVGDSLQSCRKEEETDA